VVSLANRHVDVLRTLTYVKKTGVLIGPVRRATFQSANIYSTCNAFQNHSGLFDLLPNEIFCLIFDLCTLRSISSFRRLNRHLRFQVEHYQPYTILLDWPGVPSTLRVFSRTGAELYHTAARVAQLLFTSRSEVCGKFGGYLYLPTCTRCCFKCTETNVEFSTIPYETVLRLRGNILSSQHIKRLRFLSSAPKEPRTPKRGESECYLVSFREVCITVLAFCSDRQIKCIFGPGQVSKDVDVRIFYSLAPTSDIATAREISTSFPYLNTRTSERHQQVEYARCCLACSFLPKRFNQEARYQEQKVPTYTFTFFEEEFNEEEVLKHLRGCVLVRWMWMDRNFGLSKTIYFGPLGLGPLG
ncbi:hypothetical protein CVT26_005484, partial [Gymnopilus dilepis]